MIDKEHIQYEYYMMHNVEKIWRGGWTPTPQIMNNMCNIIAYSTAQNCIYYMKQYQGLVVPVEIENLLTKIQNQILTIGPNRTAVMEDKLQPSDFETLRKFIDDNIASVL